MVSSKNMKNIVKILSLSLSLSLAQIDLEKVSTCEPISHR